VVVGFESIASPAPGRRTGFQRFRPRRRLVRKRRAIGGELHARRAFLPDDVIQARVYHVLIRSFLGLRRKRTQIMPTAFLTGSVLTANAAI